MLEIGTPVKVIWSRKYFGNHGFIVSCNESPYYAIELESGDIITLPTYMVEQRSALSAIASAAKSD